MREQWRTQRIKREEIDLIVYDFDGVMTDNRVIVMEDGKEGVIVNRSDGLGVNRFREMGVPQLILSTETNTVVEVRGNKLGILVISSCNNKASALSSYCDENGFDLKKTVYVGNDTNDVEVMKIVGFPVATADAHPETKAVAKVIMRSKGGEGVVRELAEFIVGY